MTLAKNLQDINQQEKENAIEKRAEELWLWYVNFVNTKINISALSLIKKEDAERLQIICFFAVRKKIRIWIVDYQNPEVKNFIQNLKDEWYAININLISEESFEIAFDFYNEIKEKETFDEKISEQKEEISEKNPETENFFEDKKFLKNIYTKAMEIGVSDIHFEAFENSVYVKFRHHWELQKVDEIDKKLYSRIVMEIKHKSHLILNETQIPQDWKFFIEMPDRKVDMRVSVIPTWYWEDIVIRVLDPISTKMDLKKLWFFDFQIEIIERNILKNQWAILVSWPTWSWKTSTLYSFLKKLNTWTKKIISLEDPVEYHFDWIVQSEVNKKMSFEDGLKACLRHDPDVIMLWEIRTKETAEIAMQASITWHLLLSTIHTNSAVDTIFRLKNFGIQDYLINSSVNLILAQRLAKKLCENCKIEKEFSEQDLKFIEKIDSKIWFEISEMKTHFVAWWCEKCAWTGVSWRVMICEVLEIDDEVREFLWKWKNISELKKFLKNEKQFLTLQEIWLAKVLRGEIGFGEVLGM